MERSKLSEAIEINNRILELEKILNQLMTTDVHIVFEGGRGNYLHFILYENGFKELEKISIEKMINVLEKEISKLEKMFKNL